MQANSVIIRLKVHEHNAATKGSKSKHDNPVHNQLPGTIKFQKNPNKEGEVTGGTGKKVKINGKEVAVIGSMVTTCNDTGARNNSTIIAPGASIPMPVIINPKNMAEYELEREKQNQKKPEFTTVKWGKSNVKEGEETELSAQVKDIEDGNMVTFQIWKEGQDPASHIAQLQIVEDIAGGVAKARFSYTLPGGEKLPEGDPKWFFTVHSAWCAWKQSGMIEVELKRPELSEAKWTDTDGKDTDKGLVGEAVKLSVTCNEDTEEGAGVTFKVYREGAEQDGPEEELVSSNRSGKAEAEWKPVETREAGDTKELKYFFTAITKRAKEAKSGSITVKNPQIVEMKWEPDFVYQGDEAKLKIKTFETAEFAPTVKIQVWELKEKYPEEHIGDHEVTIDSDEVELTVKTDYIREKLSAYKHESTYVLQVKVVCETLPIKQNNGEDLKVIVGDVYT
jgi:uncharacterized Zn-binding protein involved in type VI secretion